MKKLIVLFFVFPFFALSQNGGVCFEKKITDWKNVIAKAKKENKYIFLIFNYSNSKLLEKDTATINFLNSHFINILVECNTDKIDDLEIKNFTKKLLVTFNIRTYPIFLFFDENGNIVHKFLLYNPTIKMDFLNQVKIAFDQEKRYYSLVKKFENGSRDTILFKQLFNAGFLAHDSTDDYVIEFIKSRENLFSKENAIILMHTHSHFVAFDYLYNNQELWKKVIDKNILEDFYQQEIHHQVSETYYFVYHFKIDADSLIKIFEERYPKYGKEIVIDFLFNQWVNHSDKDNKELNNLINNYFDSSFISKLEQEKLNSYAWRIFEKLDDKSLLEQALNLSKKNLEKQEIAAYLDTYANILYKLGQTKEAIEAETKALSKATNADEKKSYQETLDKMKKREKTWK